MENIEQYINWDAILDDIKEEIKFNFEDFTVEDKAIASIILEDKHEISYNDCLLVDVNNITVSIGESGINANESDSQGSYWYIDINYNFDTNNITFYYEQG
jgi:hypothetical protein